METLELKVLLEWGRRLYAWCWGLAVAILVLLALYASLGQYYIGYLDNFQQRLVTDIEQRTGLDVELGSLTGQWTGLSPIIQLKGLQIRADGRVAVSLENAEITLNFLGGLINRQLFVRDLDTRGLRLHFYQHELGGWSFSGIRLGAGNQRADKLFDRLLALREVKLRDTRALLHYRGDKGAEFWSDRLDLEGDGYFRRLTATVGVDQSKPASLIAEALGDPRDKRFSADAFVRLDDSQFETLAPLFGELSELADGTASGDLWLQWRSGGDTTFQAQLQIPQLAVGAFWKRPSQQLKNMTVEVGGVLREGRWQFWVPELEAEWGQQQLLFEEFRIDQTGTEAEMLRVSLPSLDLAETQKLLSGKGLLPEKLEQVLGQLSPRGDLRRLRITLPLRPDETQKFSVESELAGLAVDAWQGAPGVTGADGYVRLLGGQGSIILDSERLALSFPGLYSESFQVQAFRGALDWRVSEEGVQVTSGTMSFRDKGAQLGALLALDLPPEASGDDPTITLSIGIRDGSAQEHKKYIPLNLPENLRNWLDRSILSGQIDSGAFVYRGSLRPGDSKDRTVQLYFDVHDANLDYHPDWPELQEIEALVEIDDGATKARVTGGSLYTNTRLQSADVSVLPIGGETRLHVGAKLGIPLSEALQVITHTPVRKQLGSAFDNWRAEGQASAMLKLDIPLQEQGRPLEVSVAANIQRGNLFLDDYGLVFHQLRGPLRFTSDEGLSSKGLSARFYQKPVAVTIQQGRGNPVRVDINTEVSADTLRDWLQQPVLDFIQGQSTFQVEIVAGDEGSQLRARSQLRGLAINLPAPFFKASAESRGLSLSLPLDAKEPLLRLVLEDTGLFQLRLGADDGRFSGAVLSLGEVDPLLLEPGVFRVNGRLPSVSLEPWQEALDHFLASSRRYAVQAGSDEQAVPIRIENLFIEDILAFDRHFESMVLQASNGAQGLSPWEIKLNNPMLAGSLMLPEEDSDQVLRAHLQRLSLPEIPEGESSEDRQPVATSLLADVDPRELLDIDVDIDHLFFGEEDWGRVGFNLRTDARGAQFRALRGQLRGIAIDGQGEEAVLRWWRDGNGDHSQVKGALFIDQIGDVLENWDVPRMMESESGRIDMDLQWPGQPDLMSPLIMTGDIAMHFDKGRLLEAPDLASGTLRMVAIFNFANVLRRLQLDFRDVFRKGIHYDDIDGNMHFENGIMSMSEPLVVEGPSSKFRMTGNLDFNTDLTDMELVATLPVRSNLPWIAALVSGLPAAAGVFIASKLFEEQMDKYASAVYGVTGPWQNPELKFRRIFDDKLSAGNDKTATGQAELPELPGLAEDEESAVPESGKEPEDDQP